MTKAKFETVWVTLSLVLGLLAPIPAAAQPRELIVATDMSFVPMEFQQGDAYTGFDIDLWDAIAKELNVAYRFQPMKFDSIIPYLKNRGIQVAIAGIAIRENRKKFIDFSDPYYVSGLSILVNINTTTIDSGKDLTGKTVAVNAGTSAVSFLREKYPGAKLDLLPDIDSLYLALAAGRVDAIVCDTPNVQYYANSIGRGRVKVVGTIKNDEYYGIAFPKGSDLVPRVNKALATLKANGQYDTIYEKWFGRRQVLLQKPLNMPKNHTKSSVLPRK